METLLAERRELLAHLLHDVKNPLSALRGYAELVRSGNVDLDPETAGYLDALTQRVEVVGDRFELLQQFSRGERGVLLRESICLNQFLKEFYQDNRPDLELSGVRFTLKLPTRRLMVRGSKERLRIALENLCFNALSFTPEDGVIALSLTEENGYALLVVRDTGAGIDAQALPHIFERGFTQRPDGSGEGLGLYLVRAIALEHGGTVSVTSERGNGSVFTLRLPIVEE
nr:HAMP domain-containing sensor histidine kinase [Pseudoflavonifractor capillosus]